MHNNALSTLKYAVDQWFYVLKTFTIQSEKHTETIRDIIGQNDNTNYIASSSL